MDSLLAIFGGAATGLAAMKNVAAAAAQPFADVLSALADRAEEPSEESDQAGLLDRVSEHLQGILSALGFEAGDAAAVRFEPSTGEVHVDHGPLGIAAEAAIAADDELLAALGQLAESEAADGEALELLIQIE